MPRYVVNVTILNPEQGMAWEGNAPDGPKAEDQAIVYFEDGGDGPLAGLTRNTDYTADATLFGARHQG